MSQKNYTVNEVIDVEYIPDNGKSGETVTMEIYDETGVKDAVNFPDVVMTERGSSGIYDGSFTPDTQGEWVVFISYGSGKGKTIKKYSVGGYNLDAIGQTVDSIDGAVGSPPMIG